MSCAHEVAGRGQTRERSREARETSGIVADGEVVWSWHPLLMSSRAEVTSAQPGADETFQSAWRRWQKEFVTGESAKEPVKTIAQGRPDVSGASAVNTRVHTYYPQRTRGCGCIGHPAFPAPSVSRRAKVSSITRAYRAAGMRKHVCNCAGRRPILNRHRPA